jgi:hypothetical protein
MLVPFFIKFRSYLNILRWISLKLNIFKYVDGIDLDYNILLKVDENLGCFWNCIKGQQQLRWYARELHSIASLNIISVNENSLEKLRTSKRTEKIILNRTINYDILEDWSYIDKFFYTQMDRRIENATGDFVTKCLYLGETMEQEE